MIPAATLVFPRLSYPFAATIHPAGPQMEASMVRWLTSVGLLTDPVMARSVKYGNFGEFTSREYPTATDEGLQLITDFFGWLFALDDAVGDTGIFGHDVANLTRLHLWLREIMDNPNAREHDALGAAVIAGCSAQQASLCKSIGTATIDSWRRLQMLSSSTQYMRCVEAATYYFVGTLWEAGWHSMRRTPSPVEYLVGRRLTTATPFGLALQDVAAGYEVPPTEYLRQDIRDLNAVVTSITALCNDIFSFPKERDETRVVALNYPAVLIAHEGLNEQDALDATAALHNQLIDQYLELETAARKGASPELIRFLSSMRSEMRGHYDWARHSPRYRLDYYFTGLDMT